MTPSGTFPATVEEMVERLQARRARRRVTRAIEVVLFAGLVFLPVWWLVA